MTRRTAPLSRAPGPGPECLRPRLRDGGMAAGIPPAGRGEPAPQPGSAEAAGGVPARPPRAARC